MKAHCLGSSSSGNCFIIELDGAKPFMVECGIAYKELLNRYLNEKECPSLSEIGLCLITHSHGDHCRAAKDIDSLGITLVGSEATLKEIGIGGIALDSLKPKTIDNGLTVMPFPVNHDCDGAVGFVIKSSKETVIFVNDSKGWTVNLSSFKPDYVFIECNHWAKQCHAVKSQNERILKTAPLGSKEYRQAKLDNDLLTRNLNYHMSLEACGKYLSQINLSRCKGIFLMHGSDRYLDKLEAKMQIKSLFGKNTYIAYKEGGFR